MKNYAACSADRATGAAKVGWGRLSSSSDRWRLEDRQWPQSAEIWPRRCRLQGCKVSRLPVRVLGKNNPRFRQPAGRRSACAAAGHGPVVHCSVVGQPRAIPRSVSDYSTVSRRLAHGYTGQPSGQQRCALRQTAMPGVPATSPAQLRSARRKQRRATHRHNPTTP